MLSSKPCLAWSPNRGEVKGGQTDPNHAGSRVHVISGGQPFGSTQLEWEHSSVMGVPSGYSEVSSAKLEYTSSVVSQKRLRNARVTRVATLAPQSRRPHSWLAGSWA